jgi:UDP-glucose 4-epimerase
VFHVAGFSHVGRSWERVDECVQTNIQGTMNLLGALEHVEHDRLVYVGTGDVYGNVAVPFREGGPVNPLSPYAVTKYAAEKLCQVLGGPIVIARPFNAYGPGQTPDRIVPETIIRALRREELKTTSGTQTREFNYVGDIVDALVLLGTTPGIEGGVFNIGSGDEIAIRDVVTKILELMGDPITADIGGLPDRPRDIGRMYCDPSKARDRLGWAPRYDLRAGLEATIAWYRTQAADARAAVGEG